MPVDELRLEAFTEHQHDWKQPPSTLISAKIKQNYSLNKYHLPANPGCSYLAIM